MSLCDSTWIYPTLDSLCFLDLVDYFLFHVSKVFKYLFQCFHKSLLSSLSGSPIIQIMVHLMLYWRPFKMSSFFFSHYFSIFCFMAVISTILSCESLMYSSVSVILLLTPSSVLFYLFLKNLFDCSLVLLGLWLAFLISPSFFF